MDKTCDQDVGEAFMSILSRQTIDNICCKLDCHKILLSENKYHRDWRGLAQHVNLEVSQIRSMKLSPTEYCIKLWVQKGLKIKDYWKCLEDMDRYDVIDDNKASICDDLKKYVQYSSIQLKSPLENIHNSIGIHDSDILTIDDVNNMNNGGSLQFYNALILYIEQDIEFVQEMVLKLEEEYQMKICLIDRELIGGVQFQFEAVARLIKERCLRVIVVLSPSFLNSRTNSFFITFAQALSIDQRRRIVIPCMVEPCQKPIVIAFCHSLDYYRTKGYWNYWEKLADSIRPISGEITAQTTDVQFAVKNDDLKPLKNVTKGIPTIPPNQFNTKSSLFDISPPWASDLTLRIPEPPSSDLDASTTSTDDMLLKKKKSILGLRKKFKKFLIK